MLMVVDGQGGGIGKVLVQKIRAALPKADIRAIGTNSIATQAMVQAGASAGATGEGAVVWNAARARVIIGVIGVFFPYSMMGEVTPKMTEAICASAAVKIAVPMARCGILVAGVKAQLNELMDEAAAKAVEYYNSIGEKRV